MSANNQTKSNGRGGPRKGAGRKPGAATKKTRLIAEEAMAEGITPLEFMLNVMRNEPPANLEPADELKATALRFEAKDPEPARLDRLQRRPTLHHDAVHARAGGRHPIPVHVDVGGQVGGGEEVLRENSVRGRGGELRVGRSLELRGRQIRRLDLHVCNTKR